MFVKYLYALWKKKVNKTGRPFESTVFYVIINKGADNINVFSCPSSAHGMCTRWAKVYYLS